MQDQTSEPHNPDHESKQTVINPQNREPVISTPPVHTQACTSGSMTLNYLLTQDKKKKKPDRENVFSGKAANVVFMATK